jgi:hypothetical protein
VVAPVGEQVLANFGIDMFVASPRTEQGTSSASHRAGSLVVLWEPPESGQLFVYSICGSDAAVALRRGLGFVPSLPPTTPGAAPAPPGDVGFSGSPLPPIASPAAPAPAERVEAPAAIGPVPIGFVRDLSVWPYVVGALSVLAAGIGLGRAREIALMPRTAAIACPLEGARS